jgi:hypothetical protein
VLISVIIPQAGDHATLSQLCARLEAGCRDGVEAEIVAVGNPGRVADQWPMRVVPPPPEGGRCRCLRAGADVATGDVLLFLNAGTPFPERGLIAIRDALAGAEEVVGGNFHLEFFEPEGASAGQAEWLTRFHAWLRRYGRYDCRSGIFVRRAIHDQLGGVPLMPVLEDYAFVRAMEARGKTCCIAEPAIHLSAALYTGRSPVAILWRWTWFHGLYHLGVSPEMLARISQETPGPRIDPS